MKRSVSLSIPKPCTESWNDFAPTPEGGFCGSCQKIVIDFTRMSDREILDYLATKRGHTCGRFRADQLKTYTFSDPNSIRPGLTLLRAGIVGLLLLFSSRPASSKNTVPVPGEIEMTQDIPHPDILVTDSVSADHWVKGVVRDEQGVPLPGISVTRKGTSQGTITNADGWFEFPRKLKAGDVLTVSFIGFISYDYVVTDQADDVDITLAAVVVPLSDLVITGAWDSHDSHRKKKARKKN